MTGISCNGWASVDTKPCVTSRSGGRFCWSQALAPWRQCARMTIGGLIGVPLADVTLRAVVCWLLMGSRMS